MPKRYQEAIRYLYGLAGSRGIRLDLSRMERAAVLRGDPQRAFRTIHVAGTNGKGSVSAMLAEMLITAGYRTGLYTSPHLHRYVERIRIDGKPVAEAALADRVAELREAFEGKEGLALTFFEMTTLLAFECFRAAGCEVAVIEVGMGGRLDATNIIAPDVSVITRIALDHTKILGSTVRRIAGEKAGIIKPGVPVVIGSRHEVARKTIVRRAREVGAPAHLIGRDFEPINGGRSLSVRAGPTQVADLRWG
jgi:dihydrofolate synthase/folylpolyglutamate synthase